MKILVPTDFSETARKAFDYGYELFKNSPDVKFVVLNSFETPKGAAGVMMNLEEVMRKEAKRDLSVELKLLKTKYPKLAISTEARYGLIENTVSRSVKENDIDFVVMGTHGASGLKKVFIGSTAEKVIESVNVPVIAVPHAFEYKPIKNIVFATDLIDVKNANLLEPICELANKNGARIHVVYVLEKASDFDLVSEVKKMKMSENFSKQETVFKVLEAVEVAKGISSYVHEIDADMVVTIPKQATFWDRLFKKSVTEQVAFETKVPLLTLRDE